MNPSVDGMSLPRDKRKDLKTVSSFISGLGKENPTKEQQKKKKEKKILNEMFEIWISQ